MDRRDFFVRLGAGRALAAAAPHLAGGQAPATRAPAAEHEREAWVGRLRRLADPVLNALAEGALKRRMPVEQAAGAGRARVTHLEALGRLVAGIAPWIELAADETAEGRLRASLAELTRRSITRWPSGRLGSHRCRPLRAIRWTADVRR